MSEVKTVWPEWKSRTEYEDQITHLQAENTRLMEALETTRRDYGEVLPDHVIKIIKTALTPQP